ncbi:NAD(P)/FAD-dependent oxidoreductase [Paenibacillus sp. CGMCC 1.16610]|uniref:NAD(P)-binding protein n=2 Tax=Paenibacillus anseongense TaxID=2682845 RepID=A0ABW9U647_9BACL|nr:NAD(P)/FAD-dependent oxidoreductase [Paenibacillus sp. CGMCC 1.16610]MBA2940316.1 NAD(P)/FAD-dependent oxidoreductase [Paenibacillus sp. CGMCC 1.16610]MVQ35493.1 NAD(P)-binding protein [Paenibacillus anseongense]
MEQYDSIIVGGGIAGLQAAIQLGRYEHRVLVIDAGYGRSTLCKSYHNLLGWPDGVSGEELRRLGRLQAERLGVAFAQDEVVQAVNKGKPGDGFELWGKSGQGYEAPTLLLATGLMDRIPEIPGLKPCLGLTIYVCPDCDGYEIKNKETIVMGSGDVGAAMALKLSLRTDKLTYVNHGLCAVKGSHLEELKKKGITYIADDIQEVLGQENGLFGGLVTVNGKRLQAERGFIAFGGNEVKSDLARQLGAERLENRHIMTDARSKMTSVPFLWAAGDVGVHAEQVTIAMGEGAQAAIWMNKVLLMLKEEANAHKVVVRS